MRFIFCLMLLSALQTKAQTRVVVQVTNFENNKGVCMVCLFNNATAFSGKGQPLKKLIACPVNNNATVIFDDVPAGVYAVSVIHDANSNNRFDTNFIGIPTEGYGASQNKLPFAAAPRFDANKFNVSANQTTTVDIKLRYLL